MKQNAVGKMDAYVIEDKSSVCGIIKGIQWNKNNWAEGCDFRGNDVKNVRSRSEECVGLCASNSLCSHFNWNSAFGGTCWMKQYYGVSKNDAVVTSDASSICGII